MNIVTIIITVGTAQAHLGGVAIWESQNEVMCIRQLGSCLNLFLHDTTQLLFAMCSFHDNLLLSIVSSDLLSLVLHADICCWQVSEPHVRGIIAQPCKGITHLSILSKQGISS